MLFCFQLLNDLYIMSVFGKSPSFARLNAKQFDRKYQFEESVKFRYSPLVETIWNFITTSHREQLSSHKLVLLVLLHQNHSCYTMVLAAGRAKVKTTRKDRSKKIKMVCAEKAAGNILKLIDRNINYERNDFNEGLLSILITLLICKATSYSLGVLDVYFWYHQI